MKDKVRVAECESVAMNWLPACEGFVWSPNAKTTNGKRTARTKGTTITLNSAPMLN